MSQAIPSRARNTLIGCAVMMGFWTAAASAQSSVSGAYYQIDGWDIIALLESEPSDPLERSVHSLMLFRVEAPDAPNNITAVWARRGATGWEADAWAGETRADVVLWMVNHTALPEPWSVAEDWPLDGLAAEYTLAEEAIDPKPLGAGLFLGHPFEPTAATMSDPSGLLELMEQLNEPAASSAVTTPGAAGAGGTQPIEGSGCPEVDGVYLNADGEPITTEHIWEALALSVESELATPGTMKAAFDASLNLYPGCCWREVIRAGTPTPLSAWACGDWQAPVREDTLCLVELTWSRTCSRTIRRWVQRLDFFCSATPPVFQTTTELQTESCSMFYDSPASGCPHDNLVPSPLPASPPPGAFCVLGSPWTDPWTDE